MFVFPLRLKPIKPRRLGVGLMLLGDLFTYGLLAHLALGGWLLFQTLWGRHIVGGVFLGVWLLGTWGLGVWVSPTGI